MNKETMTLLIDQYIPGFWYFIILVITHSVLSTIVHIKKKDFSFSEWPHYMKNFLYFTAFLAFTNGLKDVLLQKLNNDFISSLLFGLQAFVYSQPIGYYLDNILSSLSQLGFPVSPELTALVRSISSWMKDLMGRGHYVYDYTPNLPKTPEVVQVPEVENVIPNEIEENFDHLD